MIRITTDSTCDLPKELVEKYNITIFPLSVMLGDEEYLDDGSITQDMIFDFVAQQNILPKTATRSIPDFSDFFEEVLKSGDEIIHIGIGADLSSTFRNILLINDELNNDRLHIIDGKNLSLATGNLVLEAAILAKAGKPVDEIVKIITELADNNQSSFMVDGLDYLHKGGRVSKFTFSIGSMLKIRPRLQVINGILLNTTKEMGPYKAVIKKYIDTTLQKYKPLRPNERLMIAHSIHDRELLNYFIEYIKSKEIFGEIYETYAGSVIISHAGPNAIGLFYFCENKGE